MFRTVSVRQTQMLNSAKPTAPPSFSSRSKVRGRLPIPPLRQTLDRYLTSLESFLHEDESNGGMSFKSAYTLREKWANEFESGIGKTLQERLLSLDKVSPYNWLDDNFWINKAYLEWRTPLLVNSNWWLAFAEDPLIPRSALSGETNNNRAGTTFWQLRRAAWLIHRMLQFKRNVSQTKDAAEPTTSGAWLTENTSKMFNIARIPEPFCDTLSELTDPFSRNSRSILVMIHNWCYLVTVYQKPSPDSNTLTLLPPGNIEARLRAVVLDVESRLEQGEKALPIGALSADDRDHWASNLEYLLSLSPQNQKSHQALLQSVMGLTLENTTYFIPPTSSTVDLRRAHIRSPTQLSLDSHLHSIRGTSQNFPNRFYDKPFTVIVDPSTRAGATGEHSPVDALVPSIVVEYGIVKGVDAKAFETQLTEDLQEPAWERLDWISDEKIWKECDAAIERSNAIIENSDYSVLWFDKFGTDWIKSLRYKLSPDAFIQMALQLAWYRQRKEFTATYETVLMRMFKRGRTEVLRAYSRESRLWVLSMEDPAATDADRFRLLCDAVNSHSRRTREALMGRGFDRHLLGLKLLLRPLNGESAAIFEDELFERSSQWKLSTSGLSAGLQFKGTGFGAAYEDGYGINYLAAPEMVKFGIESKFSSFSTSTQDFKEGISSAMVDMQKLCESVIEKGSNQVEYHSNL